MLDNQVDFLQILTACATAGSLIGLFLVWLQLRQGTATREVELTLAFAKISGSPEFQNHLDEVLAITSPNLNEIQRGAALKVCVFFELVGSICSAKYMSTKLIERFYGPLIQMCYERLEPFIREQRQAPNNYDFMENFESLASRIASRRY